MTVSLRDIRLIDQTRFPTPTKFPVENPPQVPGVPVVTGQQGLLRVQWAPVSGVEGYEVAIMTSQNVANPDVNIERKVGDKNRELVYPTGNVAVTRYFAVRSFLGSFYSAWTSIVAGTSVVFGAAESAPPVPPSNPPTSDQSLPSGSNLTGGRATNLL